MPPDKNRKRGQETDFRPGSDGEKNSRDVGCEGWKGAASADPLKGQRSGDFLIPKGRSSSCRSPARECAEKGRETRRVREIEIVKKHGFPAGNAEMEEISRKGKKRNHGEIGLTREDSQEKLDLTRENGRGGSLGANPAGNQKEFPFMHISPFDHSLDLNLQ